MGSASNALMAGIRHASEHFGASLEALGVRAAELAKKIARPLEDEINAIPGRRVNYTLTARVNFTAAGVLVNQESDLFIFNIPKDGPWIMTHYPTVMWQITASEIATDVGRWRPISSWTLPVQEHGASQDILDLSLGFHDGGTGGRWFQNSIETNVKDATGAIVPNTLRHVPGRLFSNPLVLKRLPCPAYFPVKSTVGATALFDAVTFGAATAGKIVVSLPGYKISSQ